jgi:toxin FitB
VTSGTVPDFLVDTDLFIDHLRGAAAIEPGRHRLHYSVVTRAELFAGTTGTALAARLLAPFREIPVDWTIAETAGRIRRDHGLRMPDALIAATAVEHHLRLATRNTKDFTPVSGLRVGALR